MTRKNKSYSKEFKAEAAYHRTGLLEQRRPLMQAWADYVLSASPSPAPTEK